MNERMVSVPVEPRERLEQYVKGTSPYRAWRGEAPEGEPTLKRDLAAMVAAAPAVEGENPDDPCAPENARDWPSAVTASSPMGGEELSDDEICKAATAIRASSVAWAKEPDEFSHLIELTPAELRQLLAALQPSPAKVSEPVVVGPEMAERLARYLSPLCFENRRRSSRNQHAANKAKTHYRKLAKSILRFPPIKAALYAHPAPDAGSEKPQAPAEAGELIETIRTRLMGVAPDDQDVTLEDGDWLMILAALEAAK